MINSYTASHSSIPRMACVQKAFCPYVVLLAVVARHKHPCEVDSRSFLRALASPPSRLQIHCETLKEYRKRRSPVGSDQKRDAGGAHIPGVMVCHFLPLYTMRANWPVPNSQSSVRGDGGLLACAREL